MQFLLVFFCCEFLIIGMIIFSEQAFAASDVLPYRTDWQLEHSCNFSASVSFKIFDKSRAADCF